jgi:6-phosphogluconolactonase (cycloisomerase 2 family)
MRRSVRGRSRLWRGAGLTAALALFGCSPATALAADLYVANSGGTVSQFSVAADGALTPLSPATLATGAGSSGIALSPDRRSVYVANLTAGTVSQFSVSADGTLTPKTPASVAAANAAAIRLSPDGHSAYVTASVNPGLVRQFDVAADGTLSPKATPSVGTGASQPQSIAINAAGTRLYVGHNAAAVAQFSIGADGSLTSLGANATANLSQSQGIALSPDGASLYMANRGNSTVARAAVAANGTLGTPVVVGSTGGQPNRITISADGTHLYVANQQNSSTGQSVSQFTVNADGSLTALSPASISVLPSTTPRELTLSSDGHTAYTANTGSSDISLFTVNTDGTLTARTPAAVAAGGVAVEAVFSDGPTPSQSTPTLSATASGSVSVGGQISAQAGLAGGTTPTGTVTFHVYGPGDSGCAASLASSQATVTGNGTYASSPFTATVPGTYRWTATYGGDGGNTAAGPTSCSAPAAAVSVTAGAPSATTGSSSSVTDTGASLAGTVTPNGAPTYYTFEYGTSTSFGQISDVVSTGSAGTPQVASASLSGLTPNTLYYYRLTATSSAGTAFGGVLTFRTTGGTPAAPTVATGAPSAIGSTGATLAGTVNPEGQSTAFTFEYGTTTSFGQISTVVQLDDADADEPVTATLTNLTPDTTYFYRVVASNATGTSAGAVGTFDTGPGGSPVAVTGAASNIGATTATLAGTVDAHGSQTAFAFEYGTTNEFGALSAIDNAGSSNATQSVTLPISGLAPNTEYRYRIIATNANGTVAGTVGSFTTSPGT